MTTSAEFCQLLKGYGLDFFTGVPCSILKEVISTLEADSEATYVPAVREDVAVGLAVGAFLAGRRPMVLMQNSGLGVCLNALTSLAILYKIPLLMLITWRGYQGKDAPEHLIMGKAMPDLLHAIGVPFQVMDADTVEKDLDDIMAVLESQRAPAALILRRGILT